MEAESTSGIVIAKAEPEPGGFCVIVLSDGRLLSPIPHEGFSMLWTSDKVGEVSVGCELEMITTGCTTSSALVPHCNNDVPCLEMRRAARNRISAASLSKALASVVISSIHDAWPAEFMSRGSHRHLMPGMDVPSVIVLHGSIACIYEVSQHFTTFNSQHRADLQFGDCGLSAIPVICAELQASPSIAHGEGRVILSVSRPEYQGDGAYSEQELCAILLVGFVPFRSDQESDPSAPPLSTSSGSELRSDMSTLAPGSEVRCYSEDGSSAPGNGYSAAAAAHESWSLPPGHWNTLKAADNDFHFGWVKLLREKYCMAECPDSGYELLVYIHRCSATPRELQKGDKVAFKIHENRRGQPQASAPVWKLVDAEGTAGSVFGQYTGQIRRIGLNGMGLVDCEEIGNNESAWISKDCVSLGFLCVGDTISFNLERDASDTAWVSKTFWKIVAREDSQQDVDDDLDVPSEMRGNAAALEYGTSVKSAIAVVTGSKGGSHRSMSSKCSGKRGKLGDQGEALDSDFLVGRVKRTEPGSGFTFVECPASGFDRDVCVDKTIAGRGGLQVNDIVCFKVRVNSFGLPQAQSPVWKFLGEAAGVNKLPGLGKYTGRVSTVFPNGSGLVECPEVFELCGEHAYLLASHMQAGNMNVGDSLSFELHYSGEGRPLVARGFWKSCSRYSRIGHKKAAHTEAEGRWLQDGLDAWAHNSREDSRHLFRHPLQQRLREELWEPTWEPDPGRASSSSKGNRSGKGSAVSASSKVGDVWFGKAGKACDAWSTKGNDARFGKAGEAWHGKSADVRPGKTGEPWAGWSADAWFGKAGAARRGKAEDALSSKAGVSWQGKSRGAWQGNSVGVRLGKAKTKDGSYWEEAGSDAWTAAAWANSHQREEDVEEEGWDDVHRGAVTRVCIREGYSVADFRPAYLQPVYIYKYAADPALLSVHDSIACVPSPDGTGELEATPPVWKLMGGRSLRAGDYTRWFGDHKGIVSFYKESGAFGFVKSYSVRIKYGGKDAYIHQSVMERCGLVIGDQIVFNTHISSNGCPQVSAPLWKCITSLGPCVRV